MAIGTEIWGPDPENRPLDLKTWGTPPESAETGQNRVRGSKFGVWARFPSRILRFVTLGEAFLSPGGKFVPYRYFTIYIHTPKT